MSARMSMLAAVAGLFLHDVALAPLADEPPLYAVNRWRYVHAQRARKLRRRGYDVRFHRNSPQGRAIYKWRHPYAWEAA